MNILYILQQSIYNEGKWLTADSNINMAVGIFTELKKLQPDWKFYVLIAPVSDFADIESYDEIYNDSNVEFIEYDFPVNAFTNRYSFNPQYFTQKYEELPQITVVWNNITELSRNIKTTLYNNKYTPKLITCCYWLDAPHIGQGKVPQEYSYDWRQFDGFECSDLAVFTCQSTKEAFLKNAALKFAPDFIKSVTDKSTIWDFGYSKSELEQYKHRDKFDKTTILFLNRFSGINYTHHHEFIEAVNKLYERRQDFQVVFTNPNQKIPWDILEQQVKPLYIYSREPLDRKKYIELLWKADISVHLFIRELYGGCASRESIECQNMLVTPQVYEYARILGPNYNYYCNHKNDQILSLDKTLEKILNDINANKISEAEKERILQRNRKSEFSEISSKVAKDIKNIL